MSHGTDPATEAFVAHRNLLFTVAYELLGSAADAEDVLQETWLRWVEVDPGRVRDQRAYLVRITTRQSLNRLRTISRRKEAYVGPWLPEPMLTTPDVADDVELAESVSMAMMLVLETLSPTERAVFVLREAFGISYDEIAAAIDRSPAAVRQIAHRTRRHVTAGRPRGVASPIETRAALEAFQRAIETGDLQGLLDVLAPDVVLVSDGGGVKQAALRAITGAEKVARMFLRGLGRVDGTLSGAPTVVNGGPALLVRLDGEIDGVLALRVEARRITGLYYVRNPEKLTHLASATRSPGAEHRGGQPWQSELPDCSTGTTFGRRLRRASHQGRYPTAMRPIGRQVGRVSPIGSRSEVGESNGWRRRSSTAPGNLRATPASRSAT